MKRTNQAGSVVGFVVIGVVLSALLVGGVYLAARYQVRPVAEPTVSKPVTPEVKPVSPDVKPVSDKPAARPADAPAVYQTPVNNSSETPVHSTAAQLPPTASVGPIGSIFLAGITTAAGVAYIQSRRYNTSL